MITLAFLLSAAGPAFAGTSAPPAEPKSDPWAHICDAYGPGYQLVPGTTTCIKIGGSVSGRVTFSDKGGTDGFVPGAGTDSGTPKPH